MKSKSVYFGPRHDVLAKIWPSNRFGLPMTALIISFFKVGHFWIGLGNSLINFEKLFESFWKAFFYDISKIWRAFLIFKELFDVFRVFFGGSRKLLIYNFLELLPKAYRVFIKKFHLQTFTQSSLKLKLQNPGK
jgi:hypothetical protein